MSYNDPLPPELTNLEQQLRRLPLPAAKLDREATLYRCGWAAAEAHFHGRQSRRGRIWMSSSGVLAASVVVLSVLLVRQDAARQVAEVHASAATAVNASPAEDAKPIAEALPFVDFAARFAPDDTSLLAVRERALRGILPESAKTANQGEVQFQRPKTSRELLNEFIERNVQS